MPGLVDECGNMNLWWAVVPTRAGQKSCRICFCCLKWATELVVRLGAKPYKLKQLSSCLVLRRRHDERHHPLAWTATIQLRRRLISWQWGFFFGCHPSEQNAFFLLCAYRDERQYGCPADVWPPFVPRHSLRIWEAVAVTWISSPIM
jgi:hypothetical protein